MKFYSYIPHYSGSYGENTVYQGKRSDHPCVVSHLHYEFNRWPKDDFLGCTFHYIGTARLRLALEALHPPVTGIEFAEVEISGDDQEFKHVWRKGRPDSALGKWYWFKITGKAGLDDFGGGPTEDLVISERVLATLNSFTTNESVREIIEYRPEMAGEGVPQKW